MKFKTQPMSLNALFNLPVVHCKLEVQEMPITAVDAETATSHLRSQTSLKPDVLSDKCQTATAWRREIKANKDMHASHANQDL
jgi:hypothetical protein